MHSHFIMRIVSILPIALLAVLAWCTSPASAIPFSSVAPSPYSLTLSGGVLDLSGRGITSIAAGDLDRYANAGLTAITLANNTIADIPVGFWSATCCTQLQSVDLSANLLTGDSLSNDRWSNIWSGDNYVLRSVILDYNPLGFIPDDFLFNVPSSLFLYLPILSMAKTGLTSLGQGIQNPAGVYAYATLNLDGNDFGSFSEATAVSDSSLSTYDPASPLFIISMGQYFQTLSVGTFSCAGCGIRRWTPSFQFATWNSQLGSDTYSSNWEVTLNLHRNALTSDELNHMTGWLQTLSYTTVMKHNLILSSNQITSLRPQQFAGLIMVDLVLDSNPMGGAGALVAGSLSGINLITGASGVPGDAASFIAYDGSTVYVPQLYTVQIDYSIVDYRYYWQESVISLQNCGLTALPANLFLWAGTNFTIIDGNAPRAGGSWFSTFDTSNNPLSGPNAFPVGLFGGLWQSDSWDTTAYYFTLQVRCRNCSLTHLPAGWISGDDGQGNLGSKMLGLIDFSENNFGADGIDQMALRSLYPVAGQSHHELVVRVASTGSHVYCLHCIMFQTTTPRTSTLTLLRYPSVLVVLLTSRMVCLVILIPNVWISPIMICRILQRFRPGYSRIWDRLKM